MKASTGGLSWILLGLLGLTSAILCSAPVSFGGWPDVFYVGTVYGVLLGVYFVSCRGVRSPLGLIPLVGSSAVSWPIAYWGSFAAVGRIPGGTVHHGGGADPGFPLIAFGGALGGAGLLIPVVLLFRPASASRRGALAKAALGILLSAIVGGIAWELGPSLGAAIWGVLPTADIPRPESFSMAALFFVWQPVIALFIGWATSEGRKTFPIPAGEATAPEAQTSGGLGWRGFGVILAGLVVLSLTCIVPVRVRQAHRESVAERRKDTKPGSVDLPIAQPMSEEQALILQEIGDYHPGYAQKSIDMVSHEKGFERAGSMYFRTLYARTGEEVPQWPLAPRQYISVVVQQYPSSAWARYLAEYPQNMYISPDDPKQHAIVMQFNNKVRSSELTRYPGQTAIPLYYMWPSGDCVVTVDYRTRDESLEIVRAYLGKYPSSIP